MLIPVRLETQADTASMFMQPTWQKEMGANRAGSNRSVLQK
jgi:hypothetical protein